MGKAKKIEAELISLISPNPDIPKPKLTKLIIKNYRCIGSNPVEIDLNDIVVLVGANNVGKSSILKAYDLAMSQGSSRAELTIDDFPNNKIDVENLPEIELHTIIFDNAPGERWIQILEGGEMLVKERWVWHGEGKPKREGWDVHAGAWSDNVPWGAPNIANANRPEPHRVDAFDSPEKQAEAIKKLLMQALTDKVKNLKAGNNEEDNDYQKLIKQVKALQTKIVAEAKEQIDTVNKELTDLVSKVFPDYKIDFDAKAEDNLDSTINLFKAESQLLMGPENGYLSTIDRQGSGARRTLLWTAIKYISENNQKTKGDGDGVPSRPHLLLLDEPEICLHPNAIREACNVLYSLPETGNWQVMVTTHSPIFIDFSKDNTTIIKVEKLHDGSINGTTVFRPDKVQLGEDDKRNLKLLNLCDPYVAEFFFGGKVIVVEGDTEYTAFNYIKQRKYEEYKNINIIRARGKATIVSLVKILNHFGSDYSVLHDCDRPRLTTKKGKEMANPAWGNNPNILEAINSKPFGKSTRLLASLPNFEEAYFGEIAEEEKPYNALKTLEAKQDKFDIVESLLQALINFETPPPVNCIEWKSIEELEAEIQKIE